MRIGESIKYSFNHCFKNSFVTRPFICCPSYRYTINMFKIFKKIEQWEN